MKKLTLLFLCLGISLIAMSQNAGSDRKARKEARENEMIRDYTTLGKFLDTKRFVLEMEYILTESGNSKKLKPMMNFIMIDTTSCVWQSDAQDIDNDLFKVVSKVEGTVNDWELIKDNRHSSYFLKFKMFTDNGLYHVAITINSDKTTSGIINNIRNRFSFMGRVVTL